MWHLPTIKNKNKSQKYNKLTENKTALFKYTYNILLKWRNKNNKFDWNFSESDFADKITQVWKSDIDTAYYHGAIWEPEWRQVHTPCTTATDWDPPQVSR